MQSLRDKGSLVKAIDSQLKAFRFYGVQGLFGAARMGIGATSVLYMTSKGMGLSEIAGIKFVQGLIVLFAEIPTGLVADHFGRRMSCVLSCLAGALSFLLYFYGTGFSAFLAAEVANALAISFWSGAFIALLVDSQNSPGDPHRLGVVLSRLDGFTCLAIMFAGLLGSYLGEFDLRWPFVFSSVLMALAAICLAFISERRSSDFRPEFHSALQSKEWLDRAHKVIGRMKRNLFESVSLTLRDAHLRHFFIVQLLIQFSIQPALHYWQPYFKALVPNAPSATYGWIFFGYVGTSALFSFAAGELVRQKAHWTPVLLLAQFFLSSVLFAVLATTRNYMLAVGSFVIMQAVFGHSRVLLDVSVQRFIPSEQRATVLSCLSFCSRLGMLASLALIAGLTQFIEIHRLYILSSVGCGLIFSFIWKSYYGHSTMEKMVSVEVVRK